MSTTAIEAVLERVKAHSPHAADVREAEAALRELRAIREAAKTLDRLHVGDYVYNVRDHRQGDWHHPDVKAWSDASVLMGAIAKEE